MTPDFCATQFIPAETTPTGDRCFLFAFFSRADSCSGMPITRQPAEFRHPPRYIPISTPEYRPQPPQNIGDESVFVAFPASELCYTRRNSSLIYHPPARPTSCTSNVKNYPLRQTHKTPRIRWRRKSSLNRTVSTKKSLFQRPNVSYIRRIFTGIIRYFK